MRKFCLGLCSLLVLVPAVLIGILVNYPTGIPKGLSIDVQASPKFAVSKRKLTEQQKIDYERDGVVLLRGLLTPQERAVFGEEADDMVKSIRS